jgi:hypothetical protein
MDVTVLRRELCGTPEHVVGAPAQQPGDVHRVPGAGRPLALQVTGKELVERAVAGLCRSKKCSHETSVRES